MKNYIKVEAQDSLVRDVSSNAIVNNNKSDYENFLRISEQKYKEKQEFKKLKSDVDGIKNDLDEIKSLLKSMHHQLM
tara:strand:+ start:1009 stop:1239 length:231 start_codon:yes stop_codon:yes gene_type:complete